MHLYLLIENSRFLSLNSGCVDSSLAYYCDNLEATVNQSVHPYKHETPNTRCFVFVEMVGALSDSEPSTRECAREDSNPKPSGPKPDALSN